MFTLHTLSTLEPDMTYLINGAFRIKNLCCGHVHSDLDYL